MRLKTERKGNYLLEILIEKARFSWHVKCATSNVPRGLNSQKVRLLEHVGQTCFKNK